MLALLVGGALAAPGDGLPALARGFFVEGVERQANGDWRGAALRFQKVVELEPTYRPAHCRLGDVLAEDGRIEAAIQAWNGAPYDPDCVEALGRAELDRANYERARESFERLSELSAEPQVELLIGLAQVGEGKVDQAEDAVEWFLVRHPDMPGPLAELVEAIAAARQDEADQMVALLGRVVSHYPDLGDRLAAVRDAFLVEVRAVEMMGAAPVGLDPSQREQLEEARRAFAHGDEEGALALLEALVDQVTRNPDAWAALADVREATGDIQGAEYALLLARKLAPQRSALHARYAQLLATHYGGRFDRDALEAVERALEGNPDADLEWCRAELARRVGYFGVATRALENHQALGGTRRGRHPGDLCALPLDPDVLVAGLARKRATPPVIPPVDPPEGVDPEAWLDVHRARVHLDAGDDGAAMRAVESALARSPELVEALNLEGHLLTKAGDREGAVAVYERSLAVDAEQGNVMAALSELLRSVGRDEEADAMRLAAAEARSPVARLLLAKEAARWNRWWTARKRLDSYFDVATGGALYSEAVQLRDALDRRILTFWVGLGASVLVVLLLPVLWLRRRRAGKPLSTLLKRAPRSFREVARIVSSLRHEVLKHNISALPGVADALEDGDREPARWASERLFGKAGAIARFRRYIDELEELGRAHRVVLNLRHRDPVFSPLIAAMERLAGLEKRLKGGRARPSDVRAISDALNQDGFRALGHLLDGVCVVELGPDVFEAALADVLAEPAFRATRPPEWVLEVPERWSVRVFRGDLHDILVNLLRNAHEASIEAGVERLGVRLDLEEDEITGLERVEIRVVDDAPRRISTAMIRGRYIERGLGLAVDLTSRAGGSIHVESEPGWSKAVVVRLPLAEGTAT